VLHQIRRVRSLTYNGGDNAGTASANLTVAADRPGFAKVLFQLNISSNAS
jgi:hypothetical protein